jgi:multisubunit Na+/H+ antiporter MnhC subunit
MNPDSQAMWAYMATLGAIVVMTLAAALICIFVDADKHLAQIVAALGFIGAAVTGLIGVIGTFRPKGSPAATTESGDVNVNPTKEK